MSGQLRLRVSDAVLLLSYEPRRYPPRRCKAITQWPWSRGRCGQGAMHDDSDGLCHAHARSRDMENILPDGRPRCEGTTAEGARCTRAARPWARWCGTHGG